ncbi:MAG: putative manganese-dependent inorganic diphosphatase [Nanoarchaeota archaeon]
MQRPIIVTGHKNPDTDAIVSAIGYAYLLGKQGHHAKPVRLGDISKETEFVLDTFKTTPPELIHDVYSKVKDLSFDVPVTVAPDDTIFTAWKSMNKHSVKTVAVTNKANSLIGVVTLSDIANRYMDVMESNLLGQSNTPLVNLIHVLDGTLLYGRDVSVHVKGRVIIAAMTSEKMSEYVDDGDVVVVGNRTDNQLKALESGARFLIVTGGCMVEEKVIESARERDAYIISSPNDTYHSVRAINLSIPVSSVMTSEKVISFNHEEYSNVIKHKMSSTRYSSYPIVDASNKIMGFISRYHMINPSKNRLVLVDHNERSQSVAGIEETDIIEIVDHHRIGDVQSTSPIRFINDPVGSTSTIIAERFFTEQIALDRQMAGLLLSGILSDTLKFTSPTTTKRDRDVAGKLASVSGTDIDTYALEMFRAGTSIEGKTPQELFMQDFKEYDVSELKFGIAQITTMDFESIKKMKQRILSYMNEKVIAEKFDLLALVLTNIIESNSEIVFTGPSSDVLRKAFSMSEDSNEAFLKGVVSRKKQIVPVVSRYMES